MTAACKPASKVRLTASTRDPPSIPALGLGIVLFSDQEGSTAAAAAAVCWQPQLFVTDLMLQS